MREPDKLAIEISRDSITVSQPYTGEKVTYRKIADAPLLESQGVLREPLNASRAKFLAAAWKAAHETACRIGWLSS